MKKSIAREFIRLPTEEWRVRGISYREDQSYFNLNNLIFIKTKTRAFHHYTATFSVFPYVCRSVFCIFWSLTLTGEIFEIVKKRVTYSLFVLYPIRLLDLHAVLSPFQPASNIYVHRCFVSIRRVFYQTYFYRKSEFHSPGLRKK